MELKKKKSSSGSGSAKKEPAPTIVEWSLDPSDEADQLTLLASCGRGDGGVVYDEPERRKSA